jgi:hypothetical protein
MDAKQVADHFQTSIPTHLPQKTVITREKYWQSSVIPKESATPFSAATMFHFPYAVPKVTEFRCASQGDNRNTIGQTTDQPHKIIKLFSNIL